MQLLNALLALFTRDEVHLNHHTLALPEQAGLRGTIRDANLHQLPRA